MSIRGGIRKICFLTSKHYFFMRGLFKSLFSNSSQKQPKGTNQNQCQ
ncbi:MAG: hypothetical protein MRERV_1c051 [Mycoplasmataceae bacterium RV_VA103A]|nr:MAG: hypothetical protein MRERV_10c062 [Mycoplasmataceae bacterium RV_VA103A]KLL05378.1 MAG: hypothetical protein MRERV_1c051 [Mycoplasmataceae bacterium RV_VA103A]